MIRGLRIAATCVLLSAATGAAAQEARPILTLNQERLFDESVFGQRMQEEIDSAYQTLAAENRQIEAELEAEERRLTELRPTLPPEEFRPLAEAFDRRVTEIRRTQDGKSREIAARNDEAVQTFMQTALPVLAAIMEENRAEIIIESRSVFVAAQRIDITDEARERIDAALRDNNTPDED